MGHKYRFRLFQAAHEGERFTATGLARVLGLLKVKKRRIISEDGSKEWKQVCYNSNAALRVARKEARSVTKMLDGTWDIIL